MTRGSDAAPPDRSLRVRVLGGFAVEGVEERALGTRKARLLLKRLAAAAGRPVPADELAAVLWPDQLPKQPADQVSVLVSRLRAVLGAERLPRTDAGYSLAADEFDLLELEQRVAELEERSRLGETASALAAAHAALALAVGGLLPEEDGGWVDDLRPAAERLVVRARLLAAEAAMAAGEFVAARAAAQSVLDGDPYDETALRVIMKADALAGRPGAALAAYAAARHRLSEDLGFDLTPETEELHTAILRGELTTVSNTPGPVKSMVGREAELAVLDGLFARSASGAAVTVVIEAEAGMGKSTLISEWAAKAGRQALVITGRCDELGGDLPLQPIVDGLVGYLDGLGRDAASQLLGPDADVLGSLLGRASVPSRTGATTVSDPAAGRAGLFVALESLFLRAAGDRPLVLVVDDLHQAAPGTAEFLAFCGRRSASAMVVAARRPEPGPDLPSAVRVALGPLSLADAVAVAGPGRGPALHERSGGNPLFLQELARASGDELPGSLIVAVRARVGRLGPAAASVEVAAACGTEIDVALIAAVSGRPVSDVLDDIEQAANTGLLRPRGAALAFSHELIREAIEAGTSPPRREEIHRAAVAELASRPETDPLALARHARLGGDPAVAARALTAAAEAAKNRFEPVTGEALLDQAIELHDHPVARLARGRLRLARLDLGAAEQDARRAIELGAGVEGFELAGWVAYYGRDYQTALGYADEGVERSEVPAIRASCLALAGRIRHTRGHLAEAASRLEEGVAIAPAGIRGMVQVWHAQLLAHRGEPDRAVDAARRGLLDPHLAHPFTWGHGRFTLAYAHGVAGRWAAALDAVDDLDELVARQGDHRFPPVAANVRGWLLRGAGLVDEARALHEFAAASDPGPTFQEARYAGLLDLAECDLAVGRLDEAGAAVEAVRDVEDWTGAMAWRHRNRFRLLAQRVAGLDGNYAEAAAAAREVATSAQRRGDLRYNYRGLLVAATIEARSGARLDLDALAELVTGFLPLSGPDGWRELAELAQATGSLEIWHRAEAQASTVVAAARARPGIDGDRAATVVRRDLERLKP